MESISLHAVENICKVMVGNKCDLICERIVTKEEAENLAKSYGMEYYEASAKNNVGV